MPYCICDQGNAIKITPRHHFITMLAHLWDEVLEMGERAQNFVTLISFGK